jgi:phage terminase small subunit
LRAYAAHKAASQALNRNRDLLGSKLIVNDRPSPYLKIRNEAARTMISIATRLGLSPADRSGLKLGGAKGSSKWAKLIA